VAAGFVLWFTGLSGAGKSTLCAMVGASLRERGVHVEALDGDEIRKNLSKGLGFSKEDRDENVRRLGFVARLVARSGACAITAAISPYRSIRDEVRAQTPHFCEVYCKCPIPVLAERDPKGLYKRALRGEIKNFTGIDDPYEEPLEPEVLLNTDQEEPAVSARKILERLEQLGFIAPSGTGFSDEVSVPTLAPHGGDLQLRVAAGTVAAPLRERAPELPRLVLDSRAEAMARALASGCLSPLKGFIGSKDFLRISADMRLESGVFWPMPVLLPIETDVVERLEATREVALADRFGKLFAILEVHELWTHQAAGTKPCVAGDVWVFEPASTELGLRTAVSTRERFESQGLRDVIAFPTTGFASRADEHLLRAALEFGDAVAVLPCGAGADLERRVLSHRMVLERYFPSDRAFVLPSLPDSGDAVTSWLLRAIAAQNWGCARVLVPERARDGDGAPVVLRDVFQNGPAAELRIEVRHYAAPAWSGVLGATVTERSCPDPQPPLLPKAFREEVSTLMSDVASDGKS
jgi:adenylyl-sulfate kinase